MELARKDGRFKVKPLFVDLEEEEEEEGEEEEREIDHISVDSEGDTDAQTNDGKPVSDANDPEAYIGVRSSPETV